MSRGRVLLVTIAEVSPAQPAPSCAYVKRFSLQAAIKVIATPASEEVMATYLAV